MPAILTIKVDSGQHVLVGLVVPLARVAEAWTSPDVRALFVLLDFDCQLYTSRNGWSRLEYN